MDIDMQNLKCAVHGDEQAFEALIRPYLDVTYRLCLRMTDSETDASDLAQEAIVRAWRSLSSYRGQSRFSTWLYRIAYNVCLDELRRKKKNCIQSLQEMQSSGFEPEDTAATPEAELGRRETRREISRALACITPEQRAALILRDVQGLSYDRIAQILDVNLNTVKSRISRGRAALRTILEENEAQLKKYSV